MKKSELESLPAGLHHVGPCLYLQVNGEGDKRTRSWIMRYHFAGRRVDLGLGSLKQVDLKHALLLAGDARVTLLRGIDPKDERRAKVAAARAKLAADISFSEATEQYIAFHEAKWRGGDSAKQWRSSLTRFAFPRIGNLSLSDIETAHIQHVLRPIWLKIPVTADRVRNRIESILDWGTANGYRKEGPNPARWAGHLSELFPSAKKVATIKHHAAVPYDEAPAFFQKTAANNSIASQALAFLVLTAARSAEVRLATWGEIDLGKKLWVVPPARTKQGQEHTIPLSGPALAILRGLPRLGMFVFPGVKGNAPMNRNALLDALCDKTTVHGLRSSFRDWCGDRTAYPREIAEAALGHKAGNAIELSYRRGSALEKRRRLMEEWGKFLTSEPVAASGEVVALLHG
jgi:integrase